MNGSDLTSPKDYVSGQPLAESRRLISVCVPVFNEEENIPILLGHLRRAAEKLSEKYVFEFLFTDDGSKDRSYDLLFREAKQDHRIRVLKLSRNFGFQRNVLLSFLSARGEAVLEIDADLQDPPELIGEFLGLWEKGYKVVYGVRVQRNENRVLTWLRRSAYRIISRIGDIPVPIDAGDFRLVDRVIIEHLRSLTDHNVYLRGVIASFGYPQIGLRYERPPRVAGKSKFPLPKLVNLGIDGITSQSIQPLRIITLAGFGLSLITGVLATFYLVAWVLQIGPKVRGFTTLVLLQLFAISMNAMFLGIIGEYVGRIFNNVRGHPLGIVEKVIEDGVERPYSPIDTQRKLNQ